MTPDKSKHDFTGQAMLNNCKDKWRKGRHFLQQSWNKGAASLLISIKSFNLRQLILKKNIEVGKFENNLADLIDKIEVSILGSTGLSHDK